MEPYQYSPITAPKTFRLVRLLPTDTSTSPPTIKITITETSLIDPIPYDSLSYSWAVGPNDKPNRMVIVSSPSGPDTRQLFIHEPLEAAILQLATATSTPRPIFIDQICINQLSPADKATQVPLMGAIYTHSTRVIVWLGLSTPTSDDYFRFMRRINTSAPLARIIQMAGKEFLSLYDAIAEPSQPCDPALVSDRDAMLALIEANPEYPLQSAIDFMSRPWFSRLWIIQEVCLGQDAIFLCGKEAICVTCFRATMIFFTMHNARWIRTVKGDIPIRLVNQREHVFLLNAPIIRLFQERKAIHGGAGKGDLFDVVAKYNVNNRGPKIGATMPEDRIFGLMGLARKEEVWKRVRVRYGDTVGVYTDFAGLMAARRTDLLLYSQFPKNIPGLPSWVPDWSAEMRVPHGYAGLGKPVFSAGGSGETAPRIDPTSGSLVLEGIIVDRISQIGIRTLQIEESRHATEGVDYITAKLFFDETEEFVETAAKLPTSPFRNLDPDRLAQAAIRLSDFGLTEKLLLNDLAPDVAAKTLRSVREEVKKTGQMLINARVAAQVNSLGSLLQDLACTSWYWAPPNELEMLRSCAVAPREALATWVRGARLAAMDLASAICVSTPLALAIQWLAIRKRFRGMNFEGVTPSQTAALQRFGLDEALLRSEEMRDYRDHLLRNVGNRLYMTRQGFVGLCPPQAVAGDAVAVVLGGSVPHILRPRGAVGRWEYIGEAYCEGFMDGEMLKQPGQKVEEIHLE
ncbi:hypothetical protein ACHAQH_009131 [Verticillium albo-atrum]